MAKAFRTFPPMPTLDVFDYHWKQRMGRGRFKIGGTPGGVTENVLIDVGLGFGSFGKHDVYDALNRLLRWSAYKGEDAEEAGWLARDILLELGIVPMPRRKK